jgi:hypothetical protein
MPKSHNLTRIGQAIALAAACVTASPVSAAVLYATSFEPPTFTPGPIAGQDGWAEFPGSGASFVQNSFAFTGTQAVAVIPALATGQDGPYKTVNTPAPIVEQSAEIYLASSSTQSAWQFAAVGAGLVGYAGGIDIDADNTIHAITGSFPIIGTLTRDAWNEVDLSLNYATQTYTIDLNGVAIASNLAFCGTNGGCTGAVVPSYSDGIFDTFAGVSNVNDIGYIDDYSVVAVPAPVIGHGLSSVLGIGSVLFGAKLFQRSKKRRSLEIAIPHATA